MMRCVWGLVVTLCLSVAVPVQAGLMVTIGNTSIPVGQTSSVDVLLSSDSSNDVLWAFGLELEITTASGRLLEFVQTGGVPPDTQLSDSNYVFASTGSAAIDAPPFGAVGPNTTYSGLDISNDPLGVSGPFSNLLLVRLDLTTLTGNAAQAGDVFSISLVTANGGTFFWDADFNDIPLSSNVGEVTITGRSTPVVPEPASVVLLLSGLVGIAFRRNRRRNGPEGCASQPKAA